MAKAPVTSLKRGGKTRPPGWFGFLDVALNFAPTSSLLWVFFVLFIKGKEAAKIKFRRTAAPRADTAGCQEQFKLAVLLTKQHRNKQFNHSSQNMS